MSTTTSIGQRFTQLIQHLGLSKNAFAQSLDKTATVIQHLVDERNKPGYDLLCKVFETYPNVSKDWLLLGQGAMLAGEAAPATLAERPHSLAPKLPLEPIDLADLPELPRPRATAAGAGLQPADIAATLALAAATTPPARAVASSPVNPLAPAVAVAPPAVVAVSAAPVATPVPDANFLAVALQTQHLQHQLALAEQRNQHLLEQQALMQQLVNLLQRTV